jgi:hypothetical protein
LKRGRTSAEIADAPRQSGVPSFVIVARRIPHKGRKMMSKWLSLLVILYAVARAQIDDEGRPTVERRRMSESSSGVVKFYAVGDTPYGVRERVRFPLQLNRMESRADFFVHLGNIRERQQDCYPPHLDQASAILLKHAVMTTFVLPGEADWYTCLQQSLAWDHWLKTFAVFEDNWNNKMSVRHQAGNPENFSFVHKGILFISFHILNVSVVDRNSWDALVKANIRWLESELVTNFSSKDVGAVVMFAHAKPHVRRHRGFYDSLLRIASSIAKPIMYMHSDEDKFSATRDFPVPNILRVSLSKGGDEDPIEITVDSAQENPFKIHRRPYALG